MNETNTVRKVKNSNDYAQKDIISQLTEEQKSFVGVCTLLVTTITSQKFHLQHEMSFEDIQENAYKSGLSFIFSKLRESGSVNAYLDSAGKISIHFCPRNRSSHNYIEFSSEIGDFEFNDDGSSHCDLYSTDAAEYYYNILQETNKKEEALARKQINQYLIAFNTLDADYEAGEKLISDYKLNTAERIDSYFIPERGELDSVRFKDGRNLHVGAEFVAKSAGESYYSSGWASMSFEKIDFLGNIAHDLITIVLTGENVEKLQSNINYLFSSRFDGEVFHHSAKIVYNRKSRYSSEFFKRDIFIDECHVFSENFVNRFIDSYMQNKIPLIKILQDIADSLCGLPDEHTVKRIIISEPNNIIETVDEELKKEMPLPRFRKNERIRTGEKSKNEN